MEIIEFNARIKKIMKIIQFQKDNNEKHENPIIRIENHENHWNLRISWENLENHDSFKIPLEKNKNMKII